MAKVTFREERCKGCGLCVNACPRKIVKVDEMDKCVGCASCAIMCPDCVITVER